MTRVQIIEEQLPFPSGTATAQLVSVLHQTPLPDSTLRRRREYTSLETEEDANEPDSSEIDTGDDPIDEQSTVQTEGWSALSWSFIASGAMTVGTPLITVNVFVTTDYNSSWLLTSFQFSSLSLFLEII